MDYTAELSFERLVGGLLSALPPTRPDALAARLRDALGDRFTEHVTVHIQCGHSG